MMERLHTRILTRNSIANGSNVILRMGWQCQRCRTLSTTQAFRAKSKPIPKSTQQRIQQRIQQRTQQRIQQRTQQKTHAEYKTPTRAPLNAQPAPPRPNPLKHRTIPIVLGSIVLFIFATYTTVLIISLSRDPETPSPTEPSSQPDVSARYDAIARTFDASVDLNESLMRLPFLRKKLVSQARGDVLEVSIGTGRNLEFYDWDFKGFNGVGKPGAGGKIKQGKVISFTALDKSAEMMEVAHDKFGEMFPGIIGVRWVIGDAEKEIPMPPVSANERSGNKAGGKYDTVVQTMGLCSVSDPVGLLRRMGDVVREEEGRILLLEHGRGSWGWLNKVLDRSAEGHAREFGCWWNRDLGAIVKESGLEVVESRQIWWHGGTTWWIELKKPKEREA